uniref:hypothetical protein n=1 Tax=Actinobacillus pleuropneumoniae TaxID=715 RepID=UPI00155DD3D7|nr:hypothetical protein [Actinobacillus pleuropneumoniae]
MKRHPNPNNYDFDKNSQIQYHSDCFVWALENYKRLSSYENALKEQNKQLTSKDMELKKNYASVISGTYNEFQSNCWDLELLDSLKDNIMNNSDETIEKASKKAKKNKEHFDKIIDKRNEQALEDLFI